MVQLYDGDYIAEDLERLRQTGRSHVADLFDAFRFELASCEDAKWKLCRRSAEYPHPSFNCKVVECFLDRGLNVSRLRPLRGRLSMYRILYVFDNEYDAVHLLAIVQKQPHDQAENFDEYYNYQRRHPITERIEHEYDEVGFPRLHG